MSACGLFADDDDREDRIMELSQPIRPQGLGSWSRATVTLGTADTSTGAAATAASQCQKCRERQACVVVRQNEPLCGMCLEQSVVGKVRAATKGRALLEEGDRVLLALSGGAASAALLHCMLQLQNRNPERPERGKVSFEMRLVHVDVDPPGAGSDGSIEAALELKGSAAAAAATAVAAGVAGELRVVPLSSIYEEDDAQRWSLGESAAEAPLLGTVQQQQQQQQQQQEMPQHMPTKHQYEKRLHALLSAVTDPTAAEDLRAHLRQQLLWRAAAAAGCNKLLLGDCASTIAARVIADAAKGRGFSLPADIQLSDARCGPACGPGGAATDAAGSKAASASGAAAPGTEAAAPGRGPIVLLPLREVSMKEAEALANLKGLLQGSGSSSSSSGVEAAPKQGVKHGGSVNTLAHSFVEAMQANLPSSVFTVLRTASHLQAFPFNEPTAVGPAAAAAAAVAAGARSAGSSGGIKARGRGPGSAAAAAAAAACKASAALAEQVAANGGTAQIVPKFCRVCMAPLPCGPKQQQQQQQQQRQQGSAADEHREQSSASAAGMEAASTPITGPDAAAAVAERLGLCYGCNRYILQPLATAKGGQGSSRGEEEARRLLEELLPPPRRC